MAEANIGLQVLPMRVGQKEEIYAIVDKAIEVIHDSGVQYQVGALETVMEGELDQLLAIVKKAIQASIDAGAGSVMANIKVQYQPDGGVSMDEKLKKYK